MLQRFLANLSALIHSSLAGRNPGRRASTKRRFAGADMDGERSGSQQLSRLEDLRAPRDGVHENRNPDLLGPARARIELQKRAVPPGRLPVRLGFLEARGGGVELGRGRALRVTARRRGLQLLGESEKRVSVRELEERRQDPLHLLDVAVSIEDLLRHGEKRLASSGRGCPPASLQRSGPTCGRRWRPGQRS